MTELLTKAKQVSRRAMRAARAELEPRLRRNTALTADEEALLVEEYKRARGYDRPRKERSKEAHEHAAGAPLVTWTPPALRPHV